MRRITLEEAREQQEQNGAPWPVYPVDGFALVCWIVGAAFVLLVGVVAWRIFG